MEGDTKKYIIPKHLDDSPVIIFVEADTFLFAISGYLIGLFINHEYTVGIPCLFLAYIYNKIKTKKHKGFIYHWLYKIGLANPKHVPPYFLKDFGD